MRAPLKLQVVGLQENVQKTQISKRKLGSKISPMINGDRILRDPNYVDYEFRQLVESYLLEKRQENKLKERNLNVFLLDENGRLCLELTVKPLYKKVVKKKATTAYEQIQKKGSLRELAGDITIGRWFKFGFGLKMSKA